jgi:ABC-type multidrug transport system permease subunit
MKKFIYYIKNKTTTIISLIMLFFIKTQNVFAETLEGSKIATGTKNLINDATKWLLVLAPTVTVLLIIYYLIRKGMADEQEHKKWNSRIMVALVSCIGAVVASVLINVLTSYFK